MALRTTCCRCFYASWFTQLAMNCALLLDYQNTRPEQVDERSTVARADHVSLASANCSRVSRSRRACASS